MKFIYPAVFHEEKDGKYKGYFPDLECCHGAVARLLQRTDGGGRGASAKHGT